MKRAFLSAPRGPERRARGAEGTGGAKGGTHEVGGSSWLQAL